MSDSPPVMPNTTEWPRENQLTASHDLHCILLKESGRRTRVFDTKRGIDLTTVALRNMKLMSESIPATNMGPITHHMLRVRWEAAPL